MIDLDERRKKQMLNENGKRNNTVKLTALMLGTLMVLSMFSVLFTANPIVGTTTKDSSLNIPAELLPIFEDADEVGKAIEVARTMPAAEKIDDLLLNHFSEGDRSTEISLMPDGSPKIITFVAPSADLTEISMNMNIGSQVDLGMFKVLLGSVSDNSNMFDLARNPAVVLVTADAKETASFDAVEDDLTFDVVDNRVTPEQNATNDYYGIDDLWATGTDGAGVLIGLLDSGTDFGQTNLAPALGLDADGFPASLVPDSSGITLTTVDIEEDVITNSTYKGIFGLQNTSYTFPYWGDGGRYRDCPPEDINFNFTASAIPTISGTYKFGMLHQDFTDANRWPRGGQTTFFVLTDSTISGVYDEIWICWEMSAISNWLRGTMYSMYYAALDTTYPAGPLGSPGDWLGQDVWKLDPAINTSLNNEVFFDIDAALLAEEMWVNKTWGDGTFWNGVNMTGIWLDTIEANMSLVLDSPAGEFIKAGKWVSSNDGTKVANFVLAHDFDGDGYNDISAGSLANAIDTDNLIYDDVDLLEGIDPDGAGIAVMWDDHSHGTWTASTLAARSIKPYRLYDNYSADGYYSYIGFGWYGIGYESLPDNATEYYLSGVAPAADIMAVNLFTASSYITNFLWQAGFELTMPETPTLGSIWKWTGKHTAQVSSNSWGWTAAYRFAVGAPGLNFASIMIDILSAPGYFDADYPGLLFCFSSGNAGMGSGTFGGFSMSTSALTVGGSTMMHWYETAYGYDVNHDQLYQSSSRGPSTQGWSGVDVLANGYRGVSNTPVWDHGYLSNRPESAGTYGGSGNLTFGFWQGTSLSCPTVAGTAALVISELVTYDPQDVKMIIKSTAKDLGFDSFTQGAGRVDPSAAVAMATAGGWISSSKTNSENAVQLADTFESWFYDNGYGDYETGYAGGQIGYYHIFENYVTGIYDTDFYAGVVAPGDSSLGTVDFDNSTDITVDAVYNNLTEIRTDSYVTDNSTAMWASLYNETMIVVDLATLGLTQDDFDNADMIEIIVVDCNTTSTDGVGTRSSVVFNWVDDGDGIVNFGVEAGESGADGEFGLVAFLSTYYSPIARPADTFTALADASIALRYTGTQNNTINGTTMSPLNSTGDGYLYINNSLYENSVYNGTNIYEYYSIGDFRYNFTINVYERDAWDWVELTAPVSGTVWDVNLTVPADANPGIYGGYLKASTGELVPISVGVQGVVPARTPLGTQLTTWANTDETDIPFYANYRFKVGGALGYGDHHFYPISVGSTAQVLYLDIDTDAGVNVRVIDYMGVTIEQHAGGQSLTDISAYLGVSTDFYICIRATSIPEVNTPVSISAAFTDVLMDTVMPAVALDYSGDNIYPSALEGPECEITATYGVSTIFPEIDVEKVEVWVLGVTTVSLQIPFTGLMDAGGHDSETFALGVNDIVRIAFGWTGSTDCDATVLDPDGNDLGLGMGTLANPEVGNFVAAMTGNYKIEISEYTGASDADWYIDIDILRPSPVAAAGKTVTVNTQNMTGLYVQDGTYTLEVWGFTNSGTVWKHYQDYTVNNWLPPNVAMTATDVAVTSRGSTTISWSVVDPNGADIHYGPDSSGVNVIMDTIYFNVYYRIVAPPVVVNLPTGQEVLQISDWIHMMSTEDTSLVWDFTDMDKFPAGMICEFMIGAYDGSGEIGEYGITRVTLDFDDPGVTTPTVTVPTTVTETITETVNGLTFLMMISGLVGLIILRKRRK